MSNEFDPNKPPRYGVRTTDPAAAAPAQAPPLAPSESSLAAPAAGTGSSIAPPPVGTDPAAPVTGVRSSRLGLVAMVASIVVLILSPIAAAILGNAMAPFALFDSNGQPDYSAIEAAQTAPELTAISLGLVAHILLGTALGLVALIAGVIAVRRNRGRSFGIVAVVFALLAPIVSYLVFATNLLAAAL